MKRRILAAAVALLLAATLTGCAADEPPLVLAELDDTETMERVDNPEQGFYEPAGIFCKPDGATRIPASYLKRGALLHLRVSIGSFSAAAGGSDADFTPKMLAALEENFAALVDCGASAVVRFAYDNNFEGRANQEPPLAQMLRHAVQLSESLNKFLPAIAALELGMVGPWGEMHTSKLATQETWNALLDAFLDSTDSTLPVLVRRPAFYFGFTGSRQPAASHSREARVGVFNDGYLGSASDLGTYGNREEELNWLHAQNLRLPFGGEAAINIDGTNLTDVRYCGGEMFRTRTSYLNLRWNDKVIAGWKASPYGGGDARYAGQTAFRYIENRLGYRLVLRESRLSPQVKAGGLLRLSGAVENVGFGNVTKPKRAQILLLSPAGEVRAFQADVDAFSFLSGTRTEYAAELTLPKDFPPGAYRVYLRLANADSAGKLLPQYGVRLANDGLWNGELGANFIGETAVSQ